MNKILLKYYNINIDISYLLSYTSNFKNHGISEDNYKNIENILIKTEKYIKDNHQAKNSALNIFSEEIIIKFIDDVCTNFINTYEDNIKQSFFNKKLVIMKKTL